jgi:HTH-type transcriptional regulator/antitoxin HigA
MTRIENEMQYRSIMERIEELLKVVDDNTPENDRNNVELVLLSNLVADYEDIHFPIKKPSLVEILKLRMFEMGLSQTGLADLLGMNQSKISEILSGKSEPTLKQARKMAEELHISPAVVLGTR